MKSLQVRDTKGKVVGKLSLDQSYFNEQINKSLLHQVALLYLANQRFGCASTKTRSHVRGGGRKPWRQKGTGRARAGSTRSPIWRGGGVIFGPHPREYRAILPKKTRRLALQQSLNGKVKDNELVVIDKLSPIEPKTKDFVAFLAAIKARERTLIVLAGPEPNILRAARNIQGVTVNTFNNICAYEVLKHKMIIFSKQALENLIRLAKK